MCRSDITNTGSDVIKQKVTSLAMCYATISHQMAPKNETLDPLSSIPHYTYDEIAALLDYYLNF